MKYYATHEGYDTTLLFWPGVFSADCPSSVCPICGFVWHLRLSPSPPANGPGLETFGPSASAFPVWNWAENGSLPGGPGMLPIHAEQCLTLDLQSEVPPMGWLSLCWLAQRRAETVHLSNGPVEAVWDNRIEKNSHLNRRPVVIVLYHPFMANTPYTNHTVLIPGVVLVSSLVSPHFHQGGKWRPG